MSRHFRRDTFLYLLLLALLIGGSALLLLRMPAPRLPYHPQSRRADGTLVLWRWLQRMGYQVQSLSPGATALPPATDMAIFFPGHEHFSDEDAKMLYDWAAAGHTLVFVDLLDDEAVTTQFGLKKASLPGRFFDSRLFQDLPLLPESPSSLTSPIIINQRIDIGETSAALPALSQRARGRRYPVAVVQAVGDGVVWHLGPQAAPTNEALQGEMGYLVPALLRTTLAGGVILMARYQPLVQPKETASPTRTPTLFSIFIHTAWGRAALLAGLLLLLFLLLQGRRLGPPLPIPREIHRREAAEYVEAMARLKRRARHRHTVARHQSQRLRSGLADVWHIDAGLPMTEFIAALQRSAPPPTPEMLQRITETLAALASAPSEADLVRLAAEVDKILDQSP